jgi:hypothetical protein
MKTPRPTSILSFARMVSGVTLIFAAFAMTLIAASSRSAPASDISTLRGKIAVENGTHATGTKDFTQVDPHPAHL